MEELKFKVGNVEYILSEEKSLGEGIYYLKVNGRHPITITIMKVIVECPDGSKEEEYTYDPENVSGAINIAVCNVAIRFLRKIA